MTNKYEESAFPHHDLSHGLTRLDYFAAAALTGIMAHPTWAFESLLDETARYAVKQAKALIDEIDKERSP